MDNHQLKNQKVWFGTLIAKKVKRKISSIKQFLVDFRHTPRIPYLYNNCFLNDCMNKYGYLEIHTVENSSKLFLCPKQKYACVLTKNISGREDIKLFDKPWLGFYYWSSDLNEVLIRCHRSDFQNMLFKASMLKDILSAYLIKGDTY